MKTRIVMYLLGVALVVTGIAIATAAEVNVIALTTDEPLRENAKTEEPK